MGKILFTCDVECHDPARPENWFLGKVGKELWLEKVCSELSKRNIEGIFFVDFVGCEKWVATIVKVIQILKSYGQRIELHVHPSNFSAGYPYQLPDLEYDLQEQIIASAVESYTHFTGVRPQIFRAGAYGIDYNTLQLLKSYGLSDSSYYIGKPQVKVNPLNYEELGIDSYPITAAYFKYLKKYVKHDLNIMLKDVLKKQIADNNVMLFMHSFSFNKFHRKIILDTENSFAVKRFYTVMELIDAGVCIPIGVAHFKDYTYVTEVSLIDMLYNSIYIFLRKHYLIS
jgi:hypothetical protein